MKPNWEPEPAILWSLPKGDYKIPKLLEVGEGIETTLEIETEKHDHIIVFEKFLSHTWDNLESKSQQESFIEKITDVLPVERERTRTEGIHRAELLEAIDKKYYEGEKFTVRGLLNHLSVELQDRLGNSWGENKAAHLRRRLNILHMHGWLKKSKRNGRNHYSPGPKFEKYLKNHTFEDLTKP